MVVSLAESNGTQMSETPLNPGIFRTIPENLRETEAQFILQSVRTNVRTRQIIAVTKYQAIERIHINSVLRIGFSFTLMHKRHLHQPMI